MHTSKCHPSWYLPSTSPWMRKTRDPPPAVSSTDTVLSTKKQYSRVRRSRVIEILSYWARVTIPSIKAWKHHHASQHTKNNSHQTLKSHHLFLTCRIGSLRGTVLNYLWTTSNVSRVKPNHRRLKDQYCNRRALWTDPRWINIEAALSWKQVLTRRIETHRLEKEEQSSSKAQKWVKNQPSGEQRARLVLRVKYARRLLPIDQLEFRHQRI